MPKCSSAAFETVPQGVDPFICNIFKAFSYIWTEIGQVLSKFITENA